MRSEEKNRNLVSESVPVPFAHDCNVIYVIMSSLNPSLKVLFFLSESDVVEVLLSQPNVELNQQVRGFKNSLRQRKFTVWVNRSVS